MRLRSTRSKHRLFLLLAVVGVVAVACGGDHPQDALSPAGPDARTLDRLWDLTFPIATVIFFLVQGLVVYMVWRFRARSDDDAPVQVHGNAKAEIAWTIAPAVLLAIVGVFTVVTIFDINKQAEGADVVQVKVIGHQWWWEYEYKDLDIVTANELHIPVDRPIQLEITSTDVMHNFWPPKLAGKVYAIPGRTNFMKLQADEAGDYAGQCAEYCGLSHANMRLTVVAHEADAWETWVADQQRDAPAPTRASTPTTAPPFGEEDSATATPLDALAGSELFITRGCSGCHAVKGLAGANGKVGPNLTHLYSRKKFAGAIFDLDEKHLREWLRDPPAMKPMKPDNGQGMPNLGLSEDEITSLIAYLETLK